MLKLNYICSYSVTHWRCEQAVNIYFILLHLQSDWAISRLVHFIVGWGRMDLYCFCNGSEILWHFGWHEEISLIAILFHFKRRPKGGYKFKKWPRSYLRYVNLTFHHKSYVGFCHWLTRAQGHHDVYRQGKHAVIIA